MQKEEIENILAKMLSNIADGDGNNYPAEITLKSGERIQGVKIIQKGDTYIIGLTDKQREAEINNTEYFEATVIKKNKISKIYCPELSD